MKSSQVQSIAVYLRAATNNQTYCVNLSIMGLRCALKDLPTLKVAIETLRQFTRNIRVEDTLLTGTLVCSTIAANMGHASRITNML